MFTGIIEQTGIVASVHTAGGGLRLRIATPLSAALEIDDSIAVNGVCLTVVERSDAFFEADVVEETLRKTTLVSWTEGKRVNLERAMILGSRLDGHLVQGHVDTTGEIIAITQEQTGRLVDIRFPDAFAGLIIDRGSVAVDGISLTVAQLRADFFRIAIIPYTWAHTSLQDVFLGERVNLEFDLIGKYVLRNRDIGSGINR